MVGFHCGAWGAGIYGFADRFARGVFSPETIKILTGAFDDAWASVLSSDAPWAHPEYTEAGRTIIAKHIIAAANAGQTNRKALADGALLHLSRKPMSRVPAD
jgi:hypothetical protein